MKKTGFLSTFCLFMTLLSLLASLASCNIGNVTDSGPVSEDIIENTIEDNVKLKINGVNICDYTILYNIRTNTKAEAAFNYLQSEVLKEYDINLVGITCRDTDLIDKEKYSVVIGLDGNDEIIKAEYEKCEGGFIGVSGKVIYVLGKDLISLKAAVNRLLSKAEGDDKKTITVSGFENITPTLMPLKVLQYNVLYDSNKEGRPSTFLTDICDTIREQDPDVFGTQEYNTDLIQAFDTDLPQYSSYKGPGSTAPNFIYWKTDKFNLILESKKHEIFGETMQKAQAMAQDALSVLSDIMHDSDATSSARVSASTKILDLALESNNRDTILKQIEELKGMINDE